LRVVFVIFVLFKDLCVCWSFISILILYFEPRVIDALMIHAAQQIYKIGFNFPNVFKGQLTIVKLSVDKTVIDYFSTRSETLAGEVSERTLDAASTASAISTKAATRFWGFGPGYLKSSSVIGVRLSCCSLAF